MITATNIPVPNHDVVSAPHVTDFLFPSAGNSIDKNALQSFVCHFKESNSLATREHTGLQKLRDTLHPTDYDRVHSLLVLIRENVSNMYMNLKNDLFLTLGVRTKYQSDWINQYLVIETCEGEGQLPGVMAWLIPGEKKKEPLNITTREQEVLALIASGFSNKQVADKLCISIHTAINHRKHLIDKFGVKNTAEMVCEAGRRGLV